MPSNNAATLKNRHIIKNFVHIKLSVKYPAKATSVGVNSGRNHNRLSLIET